MFSSFAFRNYRLTFLYSSLSSSAAWGASLAMDWLVLDLTGSAVALGSMVGIQVIPHIFISLIGGSLSDKFNEKRILLTTTTLLLFAYASIYFAYQAGRVDFPLLAILTLLVSTLTALQGPVFTSLSIKVVREEQVANAVSLNSVTFGIGRLVGPIIAGLLISAFDTGTPFIFFAGSCIVMFIVLMQIRMKDLQQTSSDSASGNLREAFVFLNKNRVLYLPMMVAATFIGLGMSFSLISSLMVRQVFEEDSRHLGFIGIALAIGGLIGAGVITKLSVSHHRPRFQTMLSGGLLLGFSWILAAIAPTFWSYALIVIFVNLAHLLVMSTANGVILWNSPIDLQGRIYGIYLFVFHLGYGIGAPLLGVLAQEAGIRFMVGTGGVLVLLLSATLLRSSQRQSI